MALPPVLLAPKMRGLDRDRGGLFDFLGGLEDLVKARIIFTVGKSREAVRYLQFIEDSFLSLP